MNPLFINAQAAFEHYYDLILQSGVDFQNTKTMFNASFTMLKPWERSIDTSWRRWKPDYAQLEWDWYLSGNPNADMVAEKAKIWRNLQDENGEVNSNYGYQWQREGQLDYVIDQLRKNPNTRRAALSLFDGKEWKKYDKDTICTFSIHFQVYAGKLNMTVNMRSNDLVLGFCNDQYCFSKLQELVSEETEIEMGWYHHFASNLHIYERHYDLRERNSK